MNKLILALMVTIGLTACGKGEGLVEKQIKIAHLETATQYLRAGNIALESKDYMTACVNYGVAKQAVLNIGDEEKYKQALSYEKVACQAARG
jgi:hypothetical protein